MAKKNSEFITQPINLSPDVQVIVKAHRDHWPVINWQGGSVAIALQGEKIAELPTARPTLARFDEPQSNGPLSDTPEIAALKKNLPNMKKVFTNSDAFRELTGEDFSAEELEQGLMAAVAGGATVV